MAQFNPSRKFPTDFNKGNKYKPGDGVQSSTINHLIESALWVQELAFGDAVVFGDLSYEIEVFAKDSSKWTKNGNVWETRILQTTHNFSKINSIVVEKRMEDDLWENVVYSYKRYKSGTVAVIVDEKIDVRIIIKGEK